jgi:hypothetical protein
MRPLAPLPPGRTSVADLGPPRRSSFGSLRAAIETLKATIASRNPAELSYSWSSARKKFLLLKFVHPGAPLFYAHVARLDVTKSRVILLTY